MRVNIYSKNHTFFTKLVLYFHFFNWKNILFFFQTHLNVLIKKWNADEMQYMSSDRATIASPTLLVMQLMKMQTQLIADESQTTRDLAQNQHDNETDNDGEQNDLSSQNNVCLPDQNDFDFATNSNDETDSIDTINQSPVDEISTNEWHNDSEAINPTNNHKASNDLISNQKVGVTDKNKNTFVEKMVQIQTKLNWNRWMDEVA